MDEFSSLPEFAAENSGSRQLDQARSQATSGEPNIVTDGPSAYGQFHNDPIGAGTPNSWSDNRNIAELEYTGPARELDLVLFQTQRQLAECTKELAASRAREADSQAQITRLLQEQRLQLEQNYERNYNKLKRFMGEGQSSEESFGRQLRSQQPVTGGQFSSETQQSQSSFVEYRDESRALPVVQESVCLSSQARNAGAPGHLPVTWENIQAARGQDALIVRAISGSHIPVCHAPNQRTDSNSRNACEETSPPPYNLHARDSQSRSLGSTCTQITHASDPFIIHFGVPHIPQRIILRPVNGAGDHSIEQPQREAQQPHNPQGEYTA